MSTNGPEVAAVAAFMILGGLIVAAVYCAWSFWDGRRGVPTEHIYITPLTSKPKYEKCPGQYWELNHRFKLKAAYHPGDGTVRYTFNCFSCTKVVRTTVPEPRSVGDDVARGLGHIS